MTGSANVSLSAFEKQLVTDASWILTKNSIIQKVFVLFGELSKAWQMDAVLQQMPSAINKTPPKISKGENYEGLPYVMLDYPRCFSKEDVFAVRTFFWWGNFFSITLHLKGKYKMQFEQVLADAISRGELNNAWINYADEEWAHHFEHTNMNPVQLTDAAALKDKKILKLAYKLDLNDWDSAEDFLKKVFDQYMHILAD
ncbi:MAG: hypothetical protein ABL872_05475 [Lacibacter sp.]